VPWGLILLVIAIPTIPALLVYLIMKRRFKRRESKGGKNA
jgi:ABC-type glycerol-3-phosphate transport system permease component